jgi:ribosomal protein S18 acetylase RimI-like enzyme
VEAPIKLALREASIADVPALTAIDAECFPPEDRYARGLMEEIIQGKFAVDTVDRVSTLVVTAQGAGPRGEKILGFITVARDRGSGLVVTVDVHPHWRRRGVGGLLLRAGEAKLREWAVPRVILTVGTKNTAAQRLYQKEGYTFFERIKGYYESGDDALALFKELR